MADDASTDDLVIERTFAVPPDVVWEMWTDPAHFRSWYGPAGATVTVAEMDVRPGGARRICMEVERPDGTMRMWFVGAYEVVTQRERLVYTEAMAGADGEPLSEATHPVTTVDVAFSAEAGGTRVVLTHRGVPASSPGASGWAMALDALADALAGSGSGS